MLDSLFYMVKKVTGNHCIPYYCCHDDGKMVLIKTFYLILLFYMCSCDSHYGARCSSMVRVFAHGAMRGAGRSSEVERLLMVRWVVRSILHGGPI